MSTICGEKPIYEDNYVSLSEKRDEDAGPGQEYVIEHKLMEGRGDRYVTRFQFNPQDEAHEVGYIPEVALLEMLRHRLKVRFGEHGSAHIARALTSLTLAEQALVEEELFKVNQAANLTKVMQDIRPRG